MENAQESITTFMWLNQHNTLSRKIDKKQLARSKPALL